MSDSRGSEGPEPDAELTRLAEAYRVATWYYDWTGRYVTVSASTLRSVLRALGIDASTPEAVHTALERALEREWRRVIRPSVVAEAGSLRRVEVQVPHGSPLEVVVECEDGAVVLPRQLQVWVDPRWVDGVLIGRATFELPSTLPLGWHRIRVAIPHERVGEREAAVLGLPWEPRADSGEHAAEHAAPSSRDRGDELPGVALAPDRIVVRATLAVVPHALADPLERRDSGPAASDHPAVDEEVARFWGVQAQLYQARSAESWGIGDFGDLETIARWTASEGGGFVLTNPFHAPAPVEPIEPSPYLPTSRRYADPSLVRIERTREYTVLDDAARDRVDRLAASARALDTDDEIDRDAVWARKSEALGILRIAAEAAGFDQDPDYGDYLETQGRGLVDFATWCAIAEQYGPDWTAWPDEYRHPARPEVLEFAREHSDRIEFHRWLQWVIRRQSLEVQDAAHDAGLGLGIMHDLAVGVHPRGADAWAYADALVRGVTVGAPPDAFNQRGQNWSQPPWHPEALERLGYAPLREMLDAAFTGAGALRIDHILGLFRLWWIPAGATADQGTYVRYDHAAMFGVLLLEAQRHGALVVGEDLGVVEDLTREVMAERHVYGTEILWFARELDGAPLEPAHYRRECLATVTTHDLPPTLGYLGLEHVALRERLGLLTRPVADERAAEQALVDRHVERLRALGLIGEDASEDDIVAGLHRYVASSAARLFGVALADLAGDRRSINQPGTDREYPNWTLPLAGPDSEPILLGAVLGSARAVRIAEASRRHGG